MRIAFCQLIALLLIGFSAGCSVSLHPLSDEQTSVLDRQLVGVWEEIEQDEGKEDDGGPPDRYKIESKPDSKTAMLVKDLDAGDKKTPLTLFATRLGGRSYLSLGGSNEERNRVEWLIAEYRWTDKNSFQLRLLNPQPVRQAVEVGKIKGHVEERKQVEDDKVRTKDTAVVWIEEPTEGLRKFIERHPEQLFAEEWASFRRIPSSGSTKAADAR